MFLLSMSLFFYLYSGVQPFILLLFSILLNYLCGLFTHKIKNLHGKKICTVIGVCANVGILFIFKYLNSFAFAFLSIWSDTQVEWKDIVLPIGISFYTFQGISYLVDVYRGEKKGEPICQKNLFHLALYISMFPQLVAGPIVRYTDISNEIQTRNHSWQQTESGLQRFVIGLGKKVLIADILGETANSIMYEGFGMIGAGTAWLGTLCYSLQILYDFSGYSDMAIGMGKILGFRFPENFNYPYISKSIREFWRRWHMSLSSWFRDYLYIPLGGSRRGNVYLNLAIVFLVTGAWHGSQWCFLFWGAWHGLFILIERYLENHKSEKHRNSVIGKYLKSVVSWVYTILVVMLGWILFSLSDLGKTIEYVGVMFGIVKYDYVAYDISYFITSRLLLVIGVACILCVPHHRFMEKAAARVKCFDIGKDIGALLLLVICLIKVVNAQYSPFIYFRF